MEGVASDDPLIKDPIMPWVAAPPEVIDPPDRKIPYQPWAAAIGRRGVNFHKYLDPRTSCSTAGIPRLALQDASQIVQPPTDDYVLWHHDDHHAYRVIADRQPSTCGPGDQDVARAVARAVGTEYARHRHHQSQRLHMDR